MDQSSHTKNIVSETIITEILDWKIVHTDTQSLIKDLDESVLQPFREVFRREDTDSQVNAGMGWQGTCKISINGIQVKWKELGSIKDRTEIQGFLNFITPDKILETAERIMSADNADDKQSTLLWLAEFKGMLWSLLEAADKEIVKLTENLKDLKEHAQ